MVESLCIHVSCNVCTWRYKTIGDGFIFSAFTAGEMIQCDEHMFHLVGSITNDVCVYIFTYIYMMYTVTLLYYISPDNWSWRYFLPSIRCTDFSQRCFRKDSEYFEILYPINNHWKGKRLKVGHFPSFLILWGKNWDHSGHKRLLMGSSFIFIRGQQYPQPPNRIFMCFFHVPQDVFCRRRWDPEWCPCS